MVIEAILAAKVAHYCRSSTRVKYQIEYNYTMAGTEVQQIQDMNALYSFITMSNIQ